MLGLNKCLPPHSGKKRGRCVFLESVAIPAAPIRSHFHRDQSPPPQPKRRPSDILDPLWRTRALDHFAGERSLAPFRATSMRRISPSVKIAGTTENTTQPAISHKTGMVMRFTCASSMIGPWSQVNAAHVHIQPSLLFGIVAIKSRHPKQEQPSQRSTAQEAATTSGCKGSFAITNVSEGDTRKYRYMMLCKNIVNIKREAIRIHRLRPQPARIQ